MKSMRNATWIQWRCRRIGVIGSNFLTTLSRWATAFSTRCRRSRDFSDCLARKATVVDLGDNEVMNELGKGRLRKKLLDGKYASNVRIPSCKMTEFAHPSLDMHLVSRQDSAVKRRSEGWFSASPTVKGLQAGSEPYFEYTIMTPVSSNRYTSSC
jgi:hypothetical protein